MILQNLGNNFVQSLLQYGAREAYLAVKIHSAPFFLEDANESTFPRLAFSYLDNYMLPCKMWKVEVTGISYYCVFCQLTIGKM